MDHHSSGETASTNCLATISHVHIQPMYENMRSPLEAKMPLNQQMILLFPSLQSYVCVLICLAVSAYHCLSAYHYL